MLISCNRIGCLTYKVCKLQSKQKFHMSLMWIINGLADIMSTYSSNSLFSPSIPSFLSCPFVLHCSSIKAEWWKIRSTSWLRRLSERSWRIIFVFVGSCALWQMTYISFEYALAAGRVWSSLSCACPTSFTSIRFPFTPTPTRASHVNHPPDLIQCTISMTWKL